jgi:hypothetical protein
MEVIHFFGTYCWLLVVGRAFHITIDFCFCDALEYFIFFYSSGELSLLLLSPPLNQHKLLHCNHH